MGPQRIHKFVKRMVGQWRGRWYRGMSGTVARRVVALEGILGKSVLKGDRPG